MLAQLVEQLTAVPLVAVDLGSTTLKVVEVARTNGRITLRRCAVAAVEKRNPSDLVKQLLAELGITTMQVALGVASPEIIVKPFQFPPMPAGELKKAISLEAEQSVLDGYTLSDTVIDWHTLPSSSKEKVRGLFAVVPKKVLAARVQMVKTGGLRPVLVDVEELALWNAYWLLVGGEEASPKTVLLINIGARTTNLVIAKGPDELILLRHLQLGAQAFGQDQEKDWVAEVRDSLAYARSKGGLRTLDATFVTGGGSSPKAVSLLAPAVAAPVKLWNPLTHVERGPACESMKESTGPLLAIALGLALRQLS